MPTATDTRVIATLVDRPDVGDCPKEFRDLCNLLIDEQGWTFVRARGGGHKHRMYPPDRSKRFVTVPKTPSDRNSIKIAIPIFRRSGALIDENGKSAFVPPPVLEDERGIISVKMPEIDPTVQPISTIGNRWWAPESEPVPEPEPAPAPAPAPVVVPEEDHDRRGANFTLPQAIALLQQGYHISRVVKKTGWGVNHFRNLVDDTGYIALT